MKRTGLSDTSPEAQRVLAAVYRAMSPVRKWAVLGDAQRLAKRLHEAGVRQRDASASSEEIQRSWRTHMLGDLARLVERAGDTMMPTIENLNVVREVAAAFRALEIAYALGGSLASSLYGAPRYTLDADLTAEPFPGRVELFVKRFGPEYYMSVPAIEQAIRDRSTFNIIHTSVGFKVDVFIQKDRAFDRSLLSRRQPSALLDPPEPPIDVVAPEDILLLKLEWFRLGGETSDRQWLDILGVLRSQSGRLDEGYLELWAKELNVADLLEEARQEAALGNTP
jgi:hypothetical protein